MDLDLGWATLAGQDPVELFRKYSGRFPLWHVKDMDKSTKMPTEVGSEPIPAVRCFTSTTF